MTMPLRQLANRLQSQLADADAAILELEQAVHSSRETLAAHFSALLKELSIVEDADEDKVREFLARPYVIRHLGDNRYELIVPRFINFQGGWPVRHDGPYSVFLVTRFIHFLNPLPDWLAQTLGYTAPAWRGTLDGNDLVIAQGDPRDVAKKLGIEPSRIEGKRLHLKPATRFDIIRRIVREEGFLPFTPQHVPPALIRNAADFIAHDESGSLSFALRPHQQAGFNYFMQSSAISVFAYPQTGKSFIPLLACAALTGPKVIFVPRRSLADQWRARLQLFLTPEAAAEVEVATYQSLDKFRDREWSLVVMDEAHHLPADFAIEASTLRTATRIGLSATPRREDGNEDLIPALCGFPVGADWPVSEAQRPRVTVWLVKDEDAKVKLCARLVDKPTDGKTFIFTYHIAIGQQVADKLRIPLVYSKTKQPLDVIAANDMVVISSIGNEGLSFPVRRIVEIDFLFGSGMEAGQRLGRLAFDTGKASAGAHHVLMTAEEYAKYGKRLLIYEQWGLDIDVRAEGGAEIQAKAQPRDLRPKRLPAAPAVRAERPSKSAAPAKPQSEMDRLLNVPAVRKLIDDAETVGSASYRGYAQKMIRLCWDEPLSLSELQVGKGISAEQMKWYRAGATVSLKAGLLSEVGEGRYLTNRRKIENIAKLAERFNK